jgi:hypothetical protein
MRPRMFRAILVIVACLITLVVTGFLIIYSPASDMTYRQHCAKCQSNVLCIGEAIRRFATEHNGRLPDDLFQIRDAGYLNTYGPRVLICPEDRNESSTTLGGLYTSYHYLGRGWNLRDSGDIPIIIEARDNHGQGVVHVLLLSGTCLRVTRAEANNLVAKATTRVSGNPKSEDTRRMGAEP